MNESNYIGLAGVAKRLAVDGKPLHVSAVYRQMRTGIKRGDRVVKLRHVRLGKRLATTEEWISEFIHDLADGPTVTTSTSSPTVTKKRSPEERQVAIAKASARLAASGVPVS